MTHRQYEFGSLDNNFVFTSRRLPPAQTSLGNASVIDIAMKIIHILLLISGSLIDFYRRCVRSFLADQHKESKVTPSTPAALIRKACPHKMLTDVPEDSTELLFPNAVCIYDHLHIFMNALEAAITSLPWWLDFLETLRSFITVFGDRQHIKRMLAVCRMPNSVRLYFKRWKLRVFSWRWEALEIILEDLTDSMKLMFFSICQPCSARRKLRMLFTR